jgi:D-alanyl-D-alanine-carboxypeptidase/D-alanyl-D-alanine-endopeptidase
MKQGLLLAWSLYALTVAAIQGSNAFAAGLRSDNALESPLDQAVEAEAAPFFKAGCHVGLSIAVVRHDDTHFYDYGASTRGGAKLADRRSLYEIASVTKAFTAALAAKALVDNRMSLDGDFRLYLPTPYPNLAWNGQPITLRWLVTHRSGMPRDIPDTDAIFAKDDFRTRPYELLAIAKDYERHQVLAVLHDAQLRDAPGEKEAYSNAGFLVVGFGLETVYSQSFAQLMSQAILQPLGMTSTGFSVRGSDRSRLVKGYDRYGRIMPYHPLNAGAAWGLFSSTEDLAKFVRWQLNVEDRVVSQSHKPLVGSERDGVGMAWQLAFDGDDPMVWHGGGSFGTSAQVVLFPQQRDGYALLANDTCKGTESALRDIALSLHAKLR